MRLRSRAAAASLAAAKDVFLGRNGQCSTTQREDTVCLTKLHLLDCLFSLAFSGKLAFHKHPRGKHAPTPTVADVLDPLQRPCIRVHPGRAGTGWSVTHKKPEEETHSSRRAGYYALVYPLSALKAHALVAPVVWNTAPHNSSATQLPLFRWLAHALAGEASAHRQDWQNVIRRSLGVADQPLPDAPLPPPPLDLRALRLANRGALKARRSRRTFSLPTCLSRSPSQRRSPRRRRQLQW